MTFLPIAGFVIPILLLLVKLLLKDIRIWYPPAFAFRSHRSVAVLALRELAFSLPPDNRNMGATADLVPARNTCLEVLYPSACT